MPAVPLCPLGKLAVPRKQTQRGWDLARSSSRGWGGGRGDGSSLGIRSLRNKLRFIAHCCELASLLAGLLPHRESCLWM